MVLIVIYVSLNLQGYNFDIFDTDKYYHAWLDKIALQQFSVSVPVDVIYHSMVHISAPEPVASLLSYSILKLVPIPAELLLHLFNVIYLSLAYAVIVRSMASSYLKVMLIILLIIGYYEFTLLYSTHRLKIAIILIQISILSASKYPILSKNMLVLSFLTHFSLFAALPILYLLRYVGFYTIRTPDVKLIIYWAVGIVVYIHCFGVYTEYDIDDIIFRLLSGFEHKMNHAGITIQILPAIFVALYLLFVFLRAISALSISSIMLYVVIIVYFSLSTFYIGSSLMIFTFYVVLSPFLLEVYSRHGAVRDRCIQYYLVPTALYGLYRGFTLAPIPILINS